MDKKVPISRKGKKRPKSPVKNKRQPSPNIVTPFVPGNQYWKLAHNWSKPHLFTPDELLTKAAEYAKWCEENPLKEEKVFGTGVRMTINRMRAMTIQGFSLFANFTLSSFYVWEKETAYMETIAHIRSVFFSQKLEGAAADLLNPNIIARELGLSEKSDVNIKTPPITGINYIVPDDPDAKAHT